jgi:putative ATPase
MASNSPLDNSIPLAERMRPADLDGFFGQQQLLAEGKMLKELLLSGAIPSLILWGPPGTGKTSLAHIIAKSTRATFVFFSAVLAGVKEVRKIVSEAELRRETDQKDKTIFFVDEIHRFSKSQQDAFLPHVESGLFTLIGATTENPSFQVIAPLLSRCRVLVLDPLSDSDLKNIINRALGDSEKGIGKFNLTISGDSLNFLVGLADGDARNCLNILEIAATLVIHKRSVSDSQEITIEALKEASQKKTLRYDRAGDEHYNLISALHKSLRDSDPDGALYWFYRMLESGEDPMYVSRRLIRFASEDIGIADPQALIQANASRSTYLSLGSPEGELALAQTVVYLATAPKSNSIYSASKQVKKHIKDTGSLPVPLHIRNAPTALMKELGFGRNYQYAHYHKEALVEQSHLPPELEGTIFYHPTNKGYESIVKERLAKWRKILQQRHKKNE